GSSRLAGSAGAASVLSSGTTDSAARNSEGSGPGGTAPVAARSPRYQPFGTWICTSPGDRSPSSAAGSPGGTDSEVPPPPPQAVARAAAATMASAPDARVNPDTDPGCMR